RLPVHVYLDQAPQPWDTAGATVLPVVSAQPSGAQPSGAPGPSRWVWLRRSGVQLLLIPLLIAFLAGDIITRAVTANTAGNAATSGNTAGTTVSLGAIPPSVQDLQQAV